MWTRAHVRCFVLSWFVLVSCVQLRLAPWLLPDKMREPPEDYHTYSHTKTTYLDDWKSSDFRVHGECNLKQTTAHQKLYSTYAMVTRTTYTRSSPHNVCVCVITMTTKTYVTIFKSRKCKTQQHTFIFACARILCKCFCALRLHTKQPWILLKVFTYCTRLLCMDML